MKKYLEHIVVLVIGVTLIGGILYKTGTISSGYHFLDDHELIRIEYSLKEQQVTVFEGIRSWQLNDLSWRFRPLYWVERVAGTAIMGSSLFYWNCYKAVQGIFTFYLLYFTARYLKNKWHSSFLFAAIIMLGEQFMPWYRSANQENTGLFLCALTLWLIALQYHRKKYTAAGYNILICLSAIACGLVKESFTIFMPVFPAMMFWLEYCREDMAGSKGYWKKCLKRNGLAYTVILFGFAVNVYFIAFRVGVDKVGYAGFDESTGLKQYYYGIRDSLLVFLKWYTLVGILLIAAVILCYQLIEKEKRKFYIGLALISGYIIGTQLAAHAKSLMAGRYIIPAIVGYGLLFILLGYQIFEKDRFRRKVYLTVLVVLLLLEVPAAVKNARDYTYDGRLIGQFLQSIMDHTSPDSVIIGTFTDEELNLATSSWLEVNERTKEYTHDQATGDLKDTIQLAALNLEEITWEDAHVVLGYAGDKESMLAMMGIEDEQGYSFHEFGKYALIVRE